jgi:hypothetical protein
MKLILPFFVITICLTVINAEAQLNYFSYVKKQIPKYDPPRKNIAIVIDYTKSIFSDRLYVLDLAQNKIILSSRVSHAWNSGVLYARKFSNKKGSEMSSKGNYITGTKIISPKYGYAMLIKGQDPGINNNVLNREIIFHSDSKMKSKWSNGCFATPEGINKRIIDLTYNGALVCVID